MSVRGISILGSTGSIGCNTLRVITALGPEQFRVVALAAGRNIGELVDQISRFRPELVSVQNEESAAQLIAELKTRGTSAPRVITGEEGLVEVATHGDADCVVSATV